MAAMEQSSRETLVVSMSAVRQTCKAHKEQKIEGGKEEPLIGMRDLKVLRLHVEHILCFGLHQVDRMIEPSKRTVMHLLQRTDGFEETTIKESLDCLFDLVLVQDLQPLVVDRLLPELLAGYLLLVHTPEPPPHPQRQQPQPEPRADGQEERETVTAGNHVAVQEDCNRRVEALLDTLHPQRLFASLSLIMAASNPRIKHNFPSSSSSSSSSSSASASASASASPSPSSSSASASASASASPSPSLVWLKDICGTMLSNLLMRSGGLVSVIHNFLSDTRTPKLDDKALQLAVKTVCSVPRHVSAERYIESISTQLLPLLNIKRTKNSERLITAAVKITGQLIRKYPKLSRQYLLKPMMKPFHLFMENDTRLVSSIKTDSTVVDPDAASDSDDDSDDDSGGTEDGGLSRDRFISEQSLCESIEVIHKVLFGNDPDQELLSILTPIFPALFRLYCFTCTSPVNLKVAVEEIISLYFKLSDESVHVLRELIMPQFDPLPSHLYFAAGETGGVEIRKQNYVDRDFAMEAECTIQLLQNLKNTELAGDLFTELLLEFEMIRQEVNENKTAVPRSQDRYMMLLHTLSLLAENLGPSILKNTKQSAMFVSTMLHSEDTESIDLSLGLLSMLLSGQVRVKAEEEISLRELIPRLTQLTQHESSQIAEMATILRVSIVTRDDAYRGATHGATGSKAGSSTTGSTGISMDSITQVLAELQDQLIPIRTMGLRRLRRMVLKGYAVSESHMNQVLQLFRSQLYESDSYVYLAAIDGLVSLSDVLPNQTIPLLCKYFIGHSESGKMDQSLSEEVRLKIGESLVRSAQRCGEALPRYAESIVNSCITATKDPSVGVRASALSNLGELGHMLGHALHPYVHDIVYTVYSMLLLEREPEVRRACLFVLSWSLEGLNEKSLTVLQKELKDIYRMLKTVVDSDEDELTLFHARVALGSLDDIMRTYLFGNESGQVSGSARRQVPYDLGLYKQRPLLLNNRDG